MRITRLFLDSATIEKNKKVPIDRKQQHYLSTVVRLAKGGQVSVFNGTDGEWTATFEKDYVVPYIQTHPQIADYPYEITLCFAIPKHKALKEIVRQATELGVKTLRPIYSSRTEYELRDTDKLELWAIEAAQQCRRMSIPIFLPPISLQKVQANHENIFICDETSASTVICDIPILNSYTLILGPEGGFSPEELPISAQRISLGKTILRCDTAVVSAIAQIRAVYSHLTRSPR